jgi:CheY-like chemotaxis protein
MIRPRCTEKNIEFAIEFEDLSTAVISDSLRLRQVLINLLGNAVKFTPEVGKIIFKMEKLDEKDNQLLLEFSVQDTGIGISEEAVKTIFQPFEQGGTNITRQFGGTGLGLTISRRIIELMGGEIRVESQVSVGSKFFFDLWMEKSSDALSEELSMEDATDRFTGHRALLVDDVEINRMILMTLLETTGLEIDEAVNGQEAIDMVLKSPPHTYDLVFMDIQMPVMGGYEASEAIRKLDRPDALTLPIVALTANAFKEDIDKAIASGMNSHIAKPVEMDKVVEVLFRFIPHD